MNPSEDWLHEKSIPELEEYKNNVSTWAMNLFVDQGIEVDLSWYKERYQFVKDLIAQKKADLLMESWHLDSSKVKEIDTMY